MFPVVCAAAERLAAAAIARIEFLDHWNFSIWKFFSLFSSNQKVIDHLQRKQSKSRRCDLFDFFIIFSYWSPGFSLIKLIFNSQFILMVQWTALKSRILSVAVLLSKFWTKSGEYFGIHKYFSIKYDSGKDASWSRHTALYSGMLIRTAKVNPSASRSPFVFQLRAWFSIFSRIISFPTSVLVVQLNAETVSSLY